MSPHLILTGVSADDLLAWLPDCIARARQEIARHPLRPRPSAMIPCRIPAERLYLFARQMARSYVGIYEEAPSPGLPFGVPLLLLASGLCDTPDVPGELHLVIWRSAGFPLAVAEVAWLLQERFPSRLSPHSPLADFMPHALPWEQPAWVSRRPALEGTALPALEGTALPAAEGTALPAAERTALPAAHPHSGVRPSTAWLIDQIAPLPDPIDPEPFYQAWLEQYRASEGLYPRDSARSFGRSLDTVFKQLGRARRCRRR